LGRFLHFLNSKMYANWRRNQGEKFHFFRWFFRFIHVFIRIFIRVCILRIKIRIKIPTTSISSTKKITIQARFARPSWTSGCLVFQGLDALDDSFFTAFHFPLRSKLQRTSYLRPLSCSTADHPILCAIFLLFHYRSWRIKNAAKALVENSP